MDSEVNWAGYPWMREHKDLLRMRKYRWDTHPIDDFKAWSIELPESKVAEVKVKVSPTEKEVKAVEPVKAAVVEAKVDTKKGETLISKSDCFACHKVNEKLLGPSYKDVANKYSNTKANVDYLVAKIKNGGSGVWGAIPMSPHPALSDDDASAMVQYILSLK